ncbi:MAG: division/cell wall cluster transcriptional repressor MraZ [Candidatus Omnitrophica bacterium]|nr:division/cell wall cluster transcriptional repressor MraZ [Candidatus Omnitrophota bacterium]
MWYGEYHHTLDGKERFVLPAKFRDKMKSFSNKTFYLTRGLDSCLFLFHSEVWRQFEERLKGLAFTKQQSRSFNRLYFSGAQEMEIGAQGRLTIPGYLKKYAGIERDIVIVGVSDRIEIWAAQQWNTFFEENQPNFEKVSEDLFE